MHLASTHQDWRPFPFKVRHCCGKHHQRWFLLQGQDVLWAQCALLRPYQARFIFLWSFRHLSRNTSKNLRQYSSRTKTMMESRQDLLQATSIVLLWLLSSSCSLLMLIGKISLIWPVWHWCFVCESSLWKALIYSALEVVGGVAAAGVFKVTHEAGSIRKRKTSLSWMLLQLLSDTFVPVQPCNRHQSSRQVESALPEGKDMEAWGLRTR